MQKFYTLSPTCLRYQKIISFFFYKINLIGPRSTFAISLTSCRISILVKGLCCCSTGCTLATILNCKHVIALSQCSHGTLCNGILARSIRSIQNRSSFSHDGDCSIPGVLMLTISIPQRPAQSDWLHRCRLSTDRPWHLELVNL